MPETRPAKSRWQVRSWRRVFIPSAVLIVGVIGGHGVWGWQAQRAFERRVAALHAAGERVLPGDFGPGKDASEYVDNAATDLAAAAAIVEDDDGLESDSVYWAPVGTPVEKVDPRAWPFLEKAADWYTPALLRIERARTRSHCLWPAELRSPVFDVLRTPQVYGHRSLVDVLAATMIVQHHRGDDAGVVRSLRQILFLAETADKTVSAHAHGFAGGFTMNAATNIEHFAPILRIAGDGGGGGVATDDVRQLIAALCDESAFAAGLRLMVDAHRMEQMDMLTSMARDLPRPFNVEHPNLAMRFAIAPFAYRNARFQLEHLARLKPGILSSSNWPAASARFVAEPSVAEHVLMIDFTDSLRQDVKEHFQALTDRRLAAAALAVRLYREDHAGRFPPRLGDLVPAYLQAVPIDPMAENGRPIGYVPRAEQPVFYSVADNRSDEQGSEAALPGRYGQFGWWQRQDRVLYLTAREHETLYVPDPKDPAPTYGPPAPPSMADYFIPLPPWERDKDYEARRKAHPYDAMGTPAAR